MRARLCRKIYSGLLSLAQHNSAVDHQRGDPYEVSRRVARVIDRGLLSQEQRKCTVDHRAARASVRICLITAFGEQLHDHADWGEGGLGDALHDHHGVAGDPDWARRRRETS